MIPTQNSRSSNIIVLCTKDPDLKPSILPDPDPGDPKRPDPDPNTQNFKKYDT